MTPPAYRCVECSQPAPQGQLLCAACESRAATRKQPFGQTTAVPPPPIASQAYDLSSGRPLSPPPAAPPVNLNAPFNLNTPSLPAQPPFDLQGGGTAPKSSYQPNTVPPPSMPGWQHHPDPSTDPNVLLQQLKQAEGSKPASARRMTFLERLGLRMAIRVGIATVFGLFVAIARLGQHSGQSASSNDTLVEETRPSVYTHTPAANNNFASARTTMNAVPTIMVQANESGVGGAISRINAAWEDAKNIMDQAQLKLQTSGGRADVSRFMRPLEQDKQTIEQNMPDHPMQVHVDCQNMVRAIAEAEAILASTGEAQRQPIAPMSAAGDQNVAPSAQNTSPNMSGSSDNTPPPYAGNPSQSQGQPNPAEPQNQSPAGNNSPAPPAGAPSSPSSIPGSTETVPGQPNGNSNPPPSSGGSGGQ